MNISYPDPPAGYGAFDNQQEIEFPRRINLEKIDNIEFEDIDSKDYPDFCDAFISSADMNGIAMNEEELNDLNQNYGEWVHEQVFEHIF
jgi:hypothetical protein